MALAPGTRLTHYQILDLIGEGGMGSVYRAHDQRLQRDVALKVLHASDDRIWREARVAAGLSHPRICQVYDIDAVDGVQFITMELLEGESLATRLHRGPLAPQEAAQHALATLTALEALHRKELVHRDLKPSNLFITPHGLKLLDFGLTRRLVPATGDAVTQTATMAGTPRYMSPEALRGQPLDARADLFAMGAVLFEMLAGRPAFPGGSFLDVGHAVLHVHPPVLGGSVAVAALDRIIHKALAKAPVNRYESAEAMAQALRHTLAAADDEAAAVQARALTRLLVLPFRILRPDPETDFLAFSLPDAITAELAGLTESLIVRSSAVAARFASDVPDFERLTHEAEVDVVLIGTLLRAQDRLRLTAQLVEVPAGKVLWSQTAQGTMSDVFQLQDQLTLRIVESLVPSLTGDRAPRSREVPTSARAYEFYLRANQAGLKPETWTVARDLYLRAVDEDPEFAPAWACLGRMYRVIGRFTNVEPDQNLRRAQQAFERAFELSPELPVAHLQHAYLEVDLGRAQEAILRLIARLANHGADPYLLAGLGHACRPAGLLDASLAAHEHARRLDPSAPTSLLWTYWLSGRYSDILAMATDASFTRFGPTKEVQACGSWALLKLGRRAEAADAAARGAADIGEDPTRARSWFVGTRAMIDGNRDACIAAMRESVPVGDSEGFFLRACLLAQVDDRAGALELLARAIGGGFFCYPAYVNEAWLDPLRGEPEFARVLALAKARHQAALRAFTEAGGQQVLGLPPA